MTRRVLLTGARGFVGRYALEALRERGYEVHAVTTAPLTTDVHTGPTVDRRARSHDGSDADSRHAHWHRADLLEPSAAAALIAHVQPTHLLHLAWYVEPGRFWTAADNVRWVGATLNLVRSFRESGGRRAVLAGTCAEYTWTEGDGHCVEASTPLRPATLYGVSKDAVRRVCEAYGEGARLSTAWARLFLLYGPGESATRFVPAVVTALLRGDPAYCTHGRQLRDFLHAADAGDALAALLDSSVEGAVNVASGVPVTLGEVARGIGRAVGREELVRLGAIDTPAGDPLVLTADVARLRNALGWAPRYDLGRGLDETIAWWRARLQIAERATGERCHG